MTRTSVSSSSRPCAVCAGPGAGSGKASKASASLEVSRRFSARCWSTATLTAIRSRYAPGLSTGPSSSLPSSRSQVSCKASLAMSAQPSRRVRRALRSS